MINIDPKIFKITKLSKDEIHKQYREWLNYPKERERPGFFINGFPSLYIGVRRDCETDEIFYLFEQEAAQ